MPDKPDDVRGGDQPGQWPDLVASLGIYINMPAGLDELTTDFGAALDEFDARLAADANPDNATNNYISRIRELEGVHADIVGMFAEARRMVAQRLITHGHIDHAVTVLATITTAEDLCEVVASLQKTALLAGDLGVAARLESGIISRLDATDPEKAIGFFRHTRRLILADPRAGMEVAFDAVSARLAERIGDSYDPVGDWAASEVERYDFPEWPDLIAVARDDSLWAPDTPMSARIFLALDVAGSVGDILNAASGTLKGFAKTLKDFMTKSNDVFAGLPARAYLDGIIALAFYRRGFVKEGRTIIKNISQSAALGYVAEALLRVDPPAVGDAQKLALANEDRSLTVKVLLDGQWPDRSVPDAILSDIMVVRVEHAKRTAGGKGPVPSQYPIEMRAACINALADRRESEGDADEAAELRQRATRLQWQHKRGLVKYMPRKA